MKKMFKHAVVYPLESVAALVLWGVFKVLPVRAASEAGAWLGRAAGMILIGRNKIALHNMRIAFPEKTQRERRRILKKMWAHWGRFYAEMPHAASLARRVRLTGVEHLKQAQATGGFVCSAHLGNWEMYGSLPAAGQFVFNPVYRPANNPVLNWLMFRRRAGTLIPKGIHGARLILDTLKKRQFVLMLCDQKLREGIMVPFFGKPAKTPAAIATIALKMRVPILMAKCVRTPAGRFEAVIFPLENMPAGKDDAAVREVMQRINHIYEDWIRETPEQFLWIHRRYDKSEY